MIKKKYLVSDQHRIVLKFAKGTTLQQAQTITAGIQSINTSSAREVGLSLFEFTAQAQNFTGQDISAIRALPGVLAVHPVYITQDENAEIYLTDEICVQFRRWPSQAELNDIMARFGLTIRRALDVEPYYLFGISKGADALERANRIALERNILFSHPNFYTNALVRLYTPSDRYFDRQFNFYNHGQRTWRGTGTAGADIKMVQAWDISRGSSSVQVTVIDDGLDLNHQDISSSKIVAGYDFADHDSTVQPVGTNAHGTHCSGLITADHNTIGVAGISPNSKLQMMKIFRDNGSGGSNDDVARAIDSARAQGADVISNSWGYNSSDTNLVPAVRQAIIRAKTLGRAGKGCVVVFAAGNTANRQSGSVGFITFPASMSEVITVGASTRNDSVAYYSPNSNPNRNIYIELVAPSHRAYTSQISTEGFEIWSTDISGLAGYNPGTQDTMAGDVAGNYSGSFGGTSAACPQVAGAAALILALNPNLTADQVANVLTSTADKVGGYNYNAIQNRPGASLELGYGRLNVYRALQQVGTLTFQFINRIKNTTNYGTLVIDNDRQNPVPSGSYRSFPINSNHVVRTNELPFVPNWNGTGKTVKHHRFYATESDFSLNHSFQARPDIPSLQDANFLETEPATITTDLIDAPGTSGGIIQLRDPWRYYKDANNDWFQSNQFISYTVPFEIQNNSINSYGGVFLNQEIAQNKPYYSVKAEAVQDIYLSHTGKMHKFYFQNWSASPQGSADFQNVNSLETPVVFKQEGAVVSANYKGSLLSNDVNAISNTSQRKVIRTSNGHLHLFYVSMGKIWYEKSVNNGTSWYAPKTINTAEEIKSFSIDNWNNKIYIASHLKDGGESGILIDMIDENGNVSNIYRFVTENDVDSKPVIGAYNNNVFVVYKLNNIEPLKFMRLQFDGVNWRTYEIEVQNSTNLSINPSLSLVKSSNNYAPMRDFGHLVWEERSSDISSELCYIKFEYTLNLTENYFSNFDVITKGSGYELCTNGNIVAVNAELAHIGFLGQRKFYPVENNYIPDESRAVFTSLAHKGIFYSFGDDVESVSLNRCNTRWTFAWARGNNLPIQYTDSRDIRMVYQLGNLRGVDVYVTNGVVPEDMIAFAINTSIAPYPINYRAIYGEYIPEEIVITEDSREGVVSKEGADFQLNKIGKRFVGQGKAKPNENTPNPQ